MFFRRRSASPQVPNDRESPPLASGRAPAAASSCAETAHLVGPGCLKVQDSLLRWEPVSGKSVILHPHRIRRILMYGATDATGSALRLAWRSGIHIVFLSPQGHEILGKVQPAGDSPGLTWIQHQCVLDTDFRLILCRQIVHRKIDAAVTNARYFQQQGKIKDRGSLIQQLRKLQERCHSAASIESLRGYEGTAARHWFDLFGQLIPESWVFPGRRARPATDPVNGLLSLGYTLLVNRCHLMLAASDLDPLVGFLHDVRPGRPSLACDLMEPFRITVVDRLVLHLITTRQVDSTAFHQTEEGTRLNPEGFRRFLCAFENELNDGKGMQPLQEIQATIDTWIRQFRERQGQS